MTARPNESDAAPYYFTYINQIGDGDIVAILQSQIDDTRPLFARVSETMSLHRYAPEKWTIRQVLGHVNDAERMFAFRALWFARGLPDPLPSFDQNIAVGHAASNETSWAAHIDEFQRVRLTTVSLFANLPAEAWSRTGTASGNVFTVRALAYIIAGHLLHHAAILRERYLKSV
jgi:DinB superfamily